MAHKYSRQDLSMCLNYIAYWGGQNSIYFVGDSRMRALFSAFVELLSGSPAGPQRTELQSAPTKLRAVATARTDADLRSFLAALNRAPPQLVVLGHGLYQAANASMLDSLVRQFGANLSAALPQLWLAAARSQQAAVEAPGPGGRRLAVNASRYASNGLINRLNEAARRVLDPSGISVWSSSRLIAEGVGFFNSSDGVSLSPLALNWDVQVLANFYCNNHMKYSDGTCCSVPEPVTISQLLTFAFFACWAVVAGLLCLFNAFPTYAMTHQRTGSDASPFSVIDSLHELACALAKLGLLGYFFVCDRTSFFMKENKTFTALNFVIPLLYVLVLGLFFTDNSQYTQLLHRDVTDEWKGVAQLIILVLPVYMHIRVCVSSYLFLSGFGHMTYFWSRGFKGCLVRGLRVLFRMNVLVFYYFVPLVSHWFLVTFFMAVAWPRVCQATLDRRPGFTLAAAAAKLGVVVLLVSLLYASEYAFSKLFLSGPARSLFVASEDRSREWRFRWSLDRYSSLAGAAAAICIQAARHFRLLDDSH
uniref:Cas1_AcylT domain-containing protein n=1 Tax=Macrostomum lignano TaxID=282301 RepID=A0A1I8I2S6_9PLAT